MSIFKGLQEYGKMTMSITIIVCIVILIITVIGLIYVNFFFEKGDVSKSVIIDSKPICFVDRITKDNYNITGTMMVSFYYNNKEYKIPVKVYDSCYIYTKGSRVDVIFNPNDIPGTISIKANDFKWTFNIILLVLALAATLTLIYNYYLIDNKTAETVAAGTNITNSIRNLF
jgi:hypothetical protein